LQGFLEINETHKPEVVPIGADNLNEIP